MMKRLAAICLVLLALMPAVTYALLPLGFGLALLAGVSESSLILPMTAASVVIGGALSWLALGSVPGATQVTVPLMVQIDPKAPVATPTGWTAPTSGNVQPTPPSSTSPSPLYCNAHVSCPTPALGSGGWRLTQDAACQVYVAGSHWDSSTTLCTTSTGSTFGQNATALVCPTGYSNSGQSCALSDASVVSKPADGRCFIVRTGNTYGADPNDPDCASGFPAQLALTTNCVTWGGAGGDDAGGSICIDANTSESTITNNKANANATTTQTVIKGSAPVSGAAPGAGVTVKGIGEGTTAGVGTSGGGAGVAQVKIDFPTDYNKELTQALIKDSVSSLNGKLDPTGVSTDLATVKSDYATKETAHKDLLSGIGSSGLVDHGVTWAWSPIIPASSCYEPVMAFLGHSVTFAWCDKLAILKELLAWVFFVLTGFGIFEIFTKKGG